MNCGEAKWLLSPYLDGQVSGTEMHSLRHHMEDCARCQRRYASLERTQQLLTGLGAKPASGGSPT